MTGKSAVMYVFVFVQELKSVLVVCDGRLFRRVHMKNIHQAESYKKRQDETLSLITDFKPDKALKSSPKIFKF